MLPWRWHPDGGIGRIAPGYGQQVFEDGSVAGQGEKAAFGRSTLWSLQNAATLIGPYPTTHIVRHTSRAGRRAGYTVGVTETGQTGAWTTARDGEPPVYLPVPPGATGYAYTVSASGAILGSVKLARRRVAAGTRAAEVPGRPGPGATLAAAGAAAGVS